MPTRVCLQDTITVKDVGLAMTMLLFLLACAAPTTNPLQPLPGGAATDFELPIVDTFGEDRFVLSDHAGDVILVDISAFW